MYTKIVNLDIEKYSISKGLKNQMDMRSTPLNKWFNTHLSESLSGTLRKNARIGFRHSEQLYNEALAQTLGWAFESLPSSRITLGCPITEGDCHSITETGWFVDRIFRNWSIDEDVFELKYICIHTDDNGILREGVGIVLTETNISWIKPGHYVFALITEYDIKTKTWTEALNPF